VAAPVVRVVRPVPEAAMVVLAARVVVRVRWRCSARAGPVASAVRGRVEGSVVLEVLVAHPG
jgi:hypothetical protein